jgi:hypothetical protein
MATWAEPSRACRRRDGFRVPGESGADELRWRPLRAPIRVSCRSGGSGGIRFGFYPSIRLGDLIQSDTYQQKLHDGTELYPNSKRVELVNNLRSTYREVVMRQLLKEFPEIAAAVRVDQVNRVKAAVYGKDGVQPLPTPAAGQTGNPFA